MAFTSASFALVEVLRSLLRRQEVETMPGGQISPVAQVKNPDQRSRLLLKKTLESGLSGSWLRHAQRARYAGKA